MLTAPPREAATRQVSPRGFTLVELLVVISIVGISLALAVPSFSQIIANYKVRTGAESMLNGLNYARAEAVRRNAQVSFELGTGSAWVVEQVASGEQLQARADGETSNLTVTATGGSLAVTFLPTGIVAPGARLEQVTVASSVDASNARRINVLGGGLIRMCDPDAASADDPRRC